MLRFCVTLLAVIAATVVKAAEEDIISKDGVLILTSTNFEEALRKHKNILVDFYDPGSPESELLAPFYVKAAKRLSGGRSRIVLAKVDTSKHILLADKFGIYKYPTLVFFSKGNIIPYNGTLTDDGIIAWFENVFRHRDSSFGKATNLFQFHVKLTGFEFIMGV